MSQNKVTFGLDKLHIAFLKESGSSPVWDTPIHIPGVVGFAPEPQGEESTFYADNGPYFTYTSNNGYTGDLEVALIPDEILARMLGWMIDSNGMLVESTDGTQEEFALLGQVLGDKKNRRFVYYKCKASRPSKEHATRSESVEPATDTLSLTILPIEVNGKNIVKGVIESSDTNAAIYNSFYDAVVLPNATPATVTKTKLVAAIDLAGTFEAADYTATSWTALQTALTAATTVNDNNSATQAQVNATVSDLQTAILALVPQEG